MPARCLVLPATAVATRTDRDRCRLGAGTDRCGSVSRWGDTDRPVGGIANPWAAGSGAGLGGDPVAQGVHAVVGETMAGAARVALAEHGASPRDYARLATGGAGPGTCLEYCTPAWYPADHCVPREREREAPWACCWHWPGWTACLGDAAFGRGSVGKIEEPSENGALRGGYCRCRRCGHGPGESSPHGRYAVLRARLRDHHPHSLTDLSMRTVQDVFETLLPRFVQPDGRRARRSSLRGSGPRH